MQFCDLKNVAAHNFAQTHNFIPRKKRAIFHLHGILIAIIFKLYSMSATHLGGTQFASGDIEAIRQADGGEESGGHLLGFFFTGWLVISNRGTQTLISVTKSNRKIIAYV